jgi:hypothetical protein
MEQFEHINVVSLIPIVCLEDVPVQLEIQVVMVHITVPQIPCHLDVETTIRHQDASAEAGAEDEIRCLQGKRNLSTTLSLYTYSLRILQKHKILYY